jgi:hypothetical protein
MVRDWLGRFDKDAKESRKQRIFDLWLEGNENKDISEIVGLSQLLLSEITSNFGIGDLAKTELAKANHADEAFQIPIYNRRKKTVGALDNFRIISGQIYNRRKKAYGNEGGNSDRQFHRHRSLDESKLKPTRIQATITEFVRRRMRRPV